MKAKSVDVLWKKKIITTYESEYTCPKCHVTFIGHVVMRNVTRFKCERCGQELIVKEVNP